MNNDRTYDLSKGPKVEVITQAQRRRRYQVLSPHEDTRVSLSSKRDGGIAKRKRFRRVSPTKQISNRTKSPSMESTINSIKHKVLMVRLKP